MTRSTLSFRFLCRLLGVFLAAVGTLMGAAPATAQTDCSTQTDIPESECDVLVAIYDTMGGPAWDTTVWNDDQFPCSWSGVTCDGGHVIGLGWNEQGLTGTFPTSISDLTHLESILLQNDGATVPAEFFDITTLTTISVITGGLNVLQPDIVDLTNLEFLWLIEEGFSFGDPIPSYLGQLSNLTTLRLSGMGMTGSIPTELGDLTSLERLILGFNSLSGSLPTSFENLTNLQELDLGHNNLEGPLPAEWVSMSALEELHLDDNQISSFLPNGWGNLPSLRILRLEGNDIFSFVPPLWSNLSTLEELNLGQNSLTGPIPSAWGGFSSLLTIDLEDNRFTGAPPSNLADSTSPAGRALLLENNHLDGVIPDDWANGSLSALSIGGNCLTTANLDVIDVLDALDPDWFDTQCLPIFQDGFNAGNTNNWDQTVDGLP